MAIRIEAHSDEFRAAAEAFNQRMHAGGSPWGAYVEPECDWIPKRPGRKVWREHYVAVDEDGAMHGAFTLKPQEWLIRGETEIVADWQGPVSEGSVDNRYAHLAIRLIREMVKKQPALYSWGHGGNDQPVVEISRKMNWLIYETPACLLILKPFRFLRRNAYLRSSSLRRIFLDLAAFSGVGPAIIRILHFALRLRSNRRFVATATTFDRFESWADDLWERCKGDYAAIGVRNSDSMNVLAPESGWPPVTRLRIQRGDQTIGWSLVMSTRMSGDARFGDLHVGSIVDCFASPRDAGEVIWASSQVLRSRQVDVIVSNQSHPAWINGLASNGYVVLSGRRLFVASPALRQLLEPFEETARGLHLTNMDGHGPHSL